MASESVRILLIEDSPAEAGLLQEALAQAAERFDVTHALLMADALRHLRSEPYDAILLDLALPDSRGLESLEKVNSVAPHLPILVLTGLDDEATAIEAIRKDAQDYLIKGQADGRLLGRAIRYALERKRMQSERKKTEQQIKALNETLEQRVVERTLVAQQRASQLRALASELTLAEQRERRRLAQILHDHLQQLLYAARLGVATLRRRVQDQELHPSIEQVDELLDQAVEASRSLTAELSPPILYEAGLGPALEWLGREMQEKHGLAVEVEAEPEAELVAEDTRVLLFNAVRELLFNVVKHAKVPRARIKLGKPDGQQVRIVVADEGIGFDPAKLWADGTCAVGFGLFSIRERLELLGGKLLVDTAPGKGTRVTISAPTHQPIQPVRLAYPARETQLPSLEALPAAPPSAGSGKIRVLLADDHKLLREGLTNLLEELADIEVVGDAADGEMAVELALRTRPDVVLMDVSMPRLNGIEATRRITAELPQVRVIGLSMHEEADMAAAMYEAGAIAYLSKGGPSDVLIAVVRGGSPTPPAHRPGSDPQAGTG